LGDSDAESRAVLGGDAVCPLTDMGAIHAAGPDAISFVHGQITNDVASLDDVHGIVAAYCNAQGRMLALFRVLRSDDGLLLLTRRELIPGLIKRLGLFVLRAKVTLMDASSRFVAIGLTGPRAADTLAPWGLTPALEPDGAIHRQGSHIVRLSGTTPRYLLWTEIDRAQETWRALQAHAKPVGLDAWRLLDIRTGTPSVYPQTREAWVPQMVNLQLLNGISFSKGCYPGQEIIARLHYRGQLKRRMSRITLQGGGIPSPGDEIRTLDGAEAGQIVDAVAGPEGGAEALAVLRIECEAKHLTVGKSRARVVELPREGHAGSAGTVR